MQSCFSWAGLHALPCTWRLLNVAQRNNLHWNRKSDQRETSVSVTKDQTKRHAIVNMWFNAGEPDARVPLQRSIEEALVDGDPDQNFFCCKSSPLQASRIDTTCPFSHIKEIVGLAASTINQLYLEGLQLGLEIDSPWKAINRCPLSSIWKACSINVGTRWKLSQPWPPYVAAISKDNRSDPMPFQPHACPDRGASWSSISSGSKAVSSSILSQLHVRW
jgi:hypothetical protein